MMERDSIRFGDTTIEYQVRRSDRRKKTVQGDRGRRWRAGSGADGNAGRGPAKTGAAEGVVDP